MKYGKILCIVSYVLILTISYSSCDTVNSNISAEEYTNRELSIPSVSKVNAEEIKPLLNEKIILKMLCQGSQNLNNNMPVLQQLEKLTNVHLEFEILPANTEQRREKFAALMAAREPYDIVTYQNGQEIAKYGMEGIFIALNDLIKEYAPNINKKLEDPFGNEPIPYEVDCLAELTASDGNIYNIPLISPANAIGAVWSIRKDWLDRLGLEVPDTTDELYEVLKAFKNNDPNGNGLTDEIPYGTTGAGTLVYGLLPLINGFGAHITMYVDKDDDTIKYGPIESVWKDGMAFLKKLYQEGLIDPEWTEGSVDGWEAQISTNRLGMMYAWPISGIGGANNELRKIDRNYRYIAIPPFKAPSGERFKDTSTAGLIVVPRTAVTAANKYPVETIKYLDFMFSDGGNRILRYGVENIHYDKVDGKPKIKDHLLSNTTGLAEKDGIDIAPLPYISLWDKADQYKASDPDFVPEEDAHYIYRKPGMVEAPMPVLHFKESEQEKGPIAFKAINSFSYSKWVSFITGEEPLDKYDDYVAQINELGIDEVLRTYNAAYERYKRLRE